jgi:hypothetical protein
MKVKTCVNLVVLVSVVLTVLACHNNMTLETNSEKTQEQVVKNYLTAIYCNDYKTYSNCVYDEDDEYIRLSFDCSVNQLAFRKLLEEKYGQLAVVDFRIATPKESVVFLRNDWPINVEDFFQQPIVIKKIKGQKDFPNLNGLTSFSIHNGMAWGVFVNVKKQWKIQIGAGVLKKEYVKERLLIPNIKFCQKGIELLKKDKDENITNLAIKCYQEIKDYKTIQE